MTDRFGNAGEYWVNGGGHPVTCHCAPDGRCEQAQAVAEERAERRTAGYDQEDTVGTARSAPLRVNDPGSLTP